MPGIGWHVEFEFDSMYEIINYNNTGNKLNEDLSDDDVNDLLDYFNSH